MLKHADFASEWRKSRFRGLDISKFSGRECPRSPLQRGAPLASPLFEPPMLKTWIRARNLSFFPSLFYSFNGF